MVQQTSYGGIVSAPMDSIRHADTLYVRNITVDSVSALNELHLGINTSGVAWPFERRQEGYKFSN